MAHSPTQDVHAAAQAAHTDRGGARNAPVSLLSSRTHEYSRFYLIIVPAAVLFLWEILGRAGAYDPRLIPMPNQVLSVWYDLITGWSGQAGPYTRTWSGHVLASLWRVYLGFFIAVSLGMLMGLLIGIFPLFARMVDPTIQLLRNIPVTAWVPLSMVFFGLADRPAIFLISLGAFFPTVLNTTQGVRLVDIILIKAALMMGVNHWQLITKVIIKAALPSIFTGIRLSMGIAWVLVVVAEMIAVKSGIGYLLIDAYQFFRTDIVIVCMLSIGALGYLSDQIIMLMREHMLVWSKKETLHG